MKKQCKKCKNYFTTYDNRFNYCSNCRVKPENSNQKMYRDLNRQKQKQIQEAQERFAKYLRKMKIQRIFVYSLGIVYKLAILITLILILVK